MKHLFIGGPMDGELLHDVSGDKITCPEKKRKDSQITGFVYKRVDDFFDVEGYGAFIPESWNGDRAVKYMVDNYSVHVIASKRMST